MSVSLHHHAINQPVSVRHPRGCLSLWAGKSARLQGAGQRRGTAGRPPPSSPPASPRGAPVSSACQPPRELASHPHLPAPTGAPRLIPACQPPPAAPRLSSPPASPREATPSLISLTSFLGWFEEVLRGSRPRTSEVSGDPRPGGARAAARGAPVKFSLSKASTARTGGGQGAPSHMVPSPAPVENQPGPLMLPNGQKGCPWSPSPLNRTDAHFRLSQIAGPDLGSFRRRPSPPTGVPFPCSRVPADGPPCRLQGEPPESCC